MPLQKLLCFNILYLIILLRALKSFVFHIILFYKIGQNHIKILFLNKATEEVVSTIFLTDSLHRKINANSWVAFIGRSSTCIPSTSQKRLIPSLQSEWEQT